MNAALQSSIEQDQQQMTGMPNSQSLGYAVFFHHLKLCSALRSSDRSDLQGKHKKRCGWLD